MGEVVMKVGITKEPGYLYFLDKKGNVSRAKMVRGKEPGGHPEVVKATNITKEPGYLYYIDKDGNIARAKMARKGVS